MPLDVLLVFLVVSLVYPYFITNRQGRNIIHLRGEGERVRGYLKCLFYPKYFDILPCLTYCRLNRLSHTIYWKSPISILGTAGYEIYIF